MHNDLYQFLACDYFATGEGRTICLLITRAYPRSDDYDESGNLKLNHTSKVIAAREFVEEFGEWMAYCAENLPREEFMEKYGHHLPEYMKRLLNDVDQPGNLHFQQQLHLNYS